MNIRMKEPSRTRIEVPLEYETTQLEACNVRFTVSVGIRTDSVLAWNTNGFMCECMLVIG